MGCSCCDENKTNAIDVNVLDDDALICYCENVTKGQIIEALKRGAKSVKDVVDATGACKTAQHCEDLNPQKRCCAIDIMEVIKNYQNSKE